MRWFFGILGAVVVTGTLASILRNLVVPRGLRSALVRVLWLSARWLLRRVSVPVRGYQRRDAILAWLGPIVLLGMLWSWLLALLIGYSLLMQAVSGLPLLVAYREAGSSLFTLGYASGVRSQLTTLDFFAAASGPGVTALLIAYLPALYNAYNQREVEVALLQSRVSEPAWGPELLARQALVGTLDELRGLYERWERLAAEIGETHTTYPILLSFRSSYPNRDWLIALLAMMDAAAMHISLAPSAAPVAAARLMLRAGYSALRQIAAVIRVPFNPDPRPDDPIRLTFEEYAEAVDRVRRAGMPLERSAEESWPHFRGWRVNYEGIAYALARAIDSVPALWSGGRDFPATPIPPQRPEDRKPGTPD
ncbi:hypothetical protein [Rhizomonospora bruguierae]|uniref:hypothetical protein n=1 Tax=Rhizomonospora bruguierae TaxID=1581705 RepID=UPI001BCB1E16|nr:hypothetical protein [Micromonospora sp. NBRC 107566]